MAFKIKETILGISIAIVFVFFIVFGIKAFYKTPEYEDFCDPDIYQKQTATEEECIGIGGRWNPNVLRAVPLKEEAVEESKGWCESDYTCRTEFDNTRQLYNKNVFIVSGIIGIIAIIIGAILKLTSVSSGLLGGGVLTIIYGVIGYWTNLADWARFIILGITLGVLIWVGYTKINKK